MLVHTRGDILAHHESAAIVNPVNCVGVMGKGLALAFKRAYPQVFADYRRLCAQGRISPGRVYIHDLGNAQAQPRFVVSFPTKDHWRQRSRLAYIQDGMSHLMATLDTQGIQSVAIPALGAGLGGLRWADVLPIIERSAAQYPHITTTIITLRD